MNVLFVLQRKSPLLIVQKRTYKKELYTKSIAHFYIISQGGLHMDYVPDPSERSWKTAAYPWAAPDAPEQIERDWFDEWEDRWERDEEDD